MDPCPLYCVVYSASLREQHYLSISLISFDFQPSPSIYFLFHHFSTRFIVNFAVPLLLSLLDHTYIPVNSVIDKCIFTFYLFLFLEKNFCHLTFFSTSIEYFHTIYFVFVVDLVWHSRVINCGGGRQIMDSWILGFTSCEHSDNSGPQRLVTGISNTVSLNI